MTRPQSSTLHDAVVAELGRGALVQEESRRLLDVLAELRADARRTIAVIHERRRADAPVDDRKPR